MAKGNTYADGYQDALTDIAKKILAEGVDEAIEYLIVNCADPELAQAVVDVVSK